jgi:hypothetical protein
MLLKASTIVLSRPSGVSDCSSAQSIDQRTALACRRPGFFYLPPAKEGPADRTSREPKAVRIFAYGGASRMRASKTVGYREKPEALEVDRSTAIRDAQGPEPTAAGAQVWDIPHGF